MRVPASLAAVTALLLVAVAGPTDAAVAQALPPSVPTEVTVTPVDADTHAVAWTLPVVEDGVVLQRRISGAAFADYQSLPAAETSYEDTVLACGRVDYRVLTVALGGERSEPSEVAGRSLCTPANDDLEDAEDVPVGIVGSTQSDVEVDAKYATQEVSDPVFSCRFSGQAAGFDGLWYAVTPVAPARVTISTNATTLVDPAAGVPDTLLGVYRGAPSLAHEVACSDDISGSNRRSSVIVNLSPGATYYVHVAQWTDVPDTASGEVSTSFTWSTPVAAPANDHWGDASVIATSPFTETVTGAQLATLAGTDPLHACPTPTPRKGNHTLWWSFTPEFDGTLDLDTLSSSGSFTDTLLSVYTGGPGAFTTVGCNDDTDAGGSFRSEIDALPLDGGTSYSIEVARRSSGTTTTAGTVVLDAEFTVTPGLAFSRKTVPVEEGRPGDTYTARLSTQPTDDVTVTLQGDPDCEVAPTSATFTPADWDTPQELTVSAPDDNLAEATESCTITHTLASTDPAYDGTSSPTVTGTVTDALTTAITISTPADGGHYVLGSTTSADFACTDNRAGAGIASCVGTVDDGDPIDTSALGEGSLTVTLTDVHGGTEEQTNTYTVIEQPTLELSTPTVAIEEGRPGQTYTAHLSVAPTAPVTLTPVGDADCGATPATLTFTAADWDTPQTLTAAAPDDGLVEDSESCTLTHTLTSADPAYDGVTAPVTATVSDALTTAITLTTPADGGTYTQGSAVVADFACTDNRVGAGIASCVGTVADGAQVATAALGSHSFTVTLTDVHGGTATTTGSYTVVAAPPRGRPDARISGPGPVVGNNVYGGRTQRKALRTRVRTTVTYVVSVQNDAVVPDRLSLGASGAGKGYRVTYLAPHGKNITRAVRAGTHRTPSLAPGEKYAVRVVVTLGRRAVKKLKVSVRATSVLTPSASDSVILLTRRR